MARLAETPLHYKLRICDSCNRACNSCPIQQHCAPDMRAGHGGCIRINRALQWKQFLSFFAKPIAPRAYDFHSDLSLPMMVHWTSSFSNSPHHASQATIGHGGDRLTQRPPQPAFIRSISADRSSERLPSKKRHVSHRFGLASRALARRSSVHQFRALLNSGSP